MECHTYDSSRKHSETNVQTPIQHRRQYECTHGAFFEPDVEKSTASPRNTYANTNENQKTESQSQTQFSEVVTVESLSDKLLAAQALLLLQRPSKVIETTQSEEERGTPLLSVGEEAVAVQHMELQPQPLSESQPTQLPVTTEYQDQEQPASFKDNQHAHMTPNVPRGYQGKLLEISIDVPIHHQLRPLDVPYAIEKDNKLFVLVDIIDIDECENCGEESSDLLAHSVDPLQCLFAFRNLSNREERGNQTKYFRCWYCYKVFKDQSEELKSHIIKNHLSIISKKESPPNPVVIMLDTNNPNFAILREEHFTKYLCKHCPAFFYNEGEITEHVMLHFRREGVYCSSCWWLVALGKLGEHEEKHHFPRKDIKNLSSVVKLQWKRTQRQVCEKCPAVLLRGDLERHRELHENPLSVACPECGIVMESTTLFSKHMPYYHSQEEDVRSDVDRYYSQPAREVDQGQVEEGSKIVRISQDETGTRGGICR